MGKVSDLFERTFGGACQVVAQAPGRVEFVGNHTDYNGGLVMGAAIDRYIQVAARAIDEPVLRFHTEQSSGISEVDSHASGPVGDGTPKWINYPLGVVHFMREAGFDLKGGAEFAVLSNLPAGAGLSSSAALMVATGMAVSGLVGRTPEKIQLAEICQRSENVFAGVPCGILDPGVSIHGGEDKLVHIDCADLTFRQVDVPEGVRLWIFETGTKHSLVDSLYATRRRECEMAFGILRSRFPEARSLSDLRRSDLIDARILLDEAQYKRARHVVEENARVREVERSLAEGDLEGMGQLLFESHGSSQYFFENSTDELDTLVALLKQREHVYGARLTGGGFGGAVLAVTDTEFNADDAQAVANAYQQEHKHPPEFHTFSIAEGASVSAYETSMAN